MNRITDYLRKTEQQTLVGVLDDPEPIDETPFEGDLFFDVRIKPFNGQTSPERESVHLVVTSPPYYIAKDYADEIGNSDEDDLGAADSYEDWLDKMDEHAWRPCFDALVPGGHIVVNVSNIISEGKRIPVALDTWKRLEAIGFELVSDDLWIKPGEPEADDTEKQAGFNYPCGAVLIQNPFPRYYTPSPTTEYIWVMKKPGNLSREKRDCDRIDPRTVKLNVTQCKRFSPRSAQRDNHPAPYPNELPATYIQLLSQKGEVVLDPFLGTGSTMSAAQLHERSCIGYELYSRHLPRIIGNKFAEGAVQAGSVPRDTFMREALKHNLNTHSGRGKVMWGQSTLWGGQRRYRIDYANPTPTERGNQENDDGR